MKVTIAGRIYCCGTCALWRRVAGCTMPATPSTVNCGATRFDDLCEQWYPSHGSKRMRRRWHVRSERGRFRSKISTDYRWWGRVAHYLDGAIYGADS